MSHCQAFKRPVSVLLQSALALFVAALAALRPPVDVNADAPNGQIQQISSSQVPDGLTAGEWGSIQEQMRAAQYQFTWQVRDGQWAYRAPNPGQGFSVAFAPDGLRASGYGSDGTPAWEFGLALTGYGAPDELSAKRTRVAYRWSRALTEWYENRPEGVEHGLTLAAPPPGTDGAQVELTFALRGNLRPRLDASGQALRLQDAQGSTVLLYDQLRVYDATGGQLPARFSLPLGGEGRGEGGTLRLVIDAASAAYPLTVDPLLHSEAAILHASDAQAYDDFGWSVSIRGDTLVVGAAYENGGAGDPLNWAGAAYVFERNQGGADNWGEVTILRASDAQANDAFGSSVSISGDTLVVGADYEDGGAGDPRSEAGAAYVFERNQGGADNWGEVTKLTASDAQMFDWFGKSVSISGDTIVVGASGEDGGAGDPRSNAGAVYVFVILKPEIDVQRPAGTSIGDGGTDDVGDRTVGAVNLAYTIDNTAGTAALNVTGVTASSYFNSSGFSVGTPLPLNVAAGATATLDVSFYVDDPGAFSLDVDIANDDADENPYDITISGTGTGTAPEMDVQGNGISIPNGDTTPSPADHTDFGSTDVDGGMVVRTFTIENTGSADLNLTGCPAACVVVGGAHAADFTVIADPGTPVGGTTTFEVRFDPSAVGLRSATVSIANDDLDENPYTFAIQGMAVEPHYLFLTFVCNNWSP